MKLSEDVIDHPKVTERQYARHLATYIGDPSTIRARVKDRFGRAPDIDEIKKMRDLYANKVDGRFRKIEALAPPEPKAPPKRVVHVFTPPEPRATPHVKPVVGVAKELIVSVARIFGVTPDDIRGKSRVRHLVDARSIVAIVLKSRDWSYPVIGGELGGRDHSTIINAVNRFEARAKRIPRLQAILDAHLEGFGL